MAVAICEASANQGGEEGGEPLPLHCCRPRLGRPAELAPAFSGKTVLVVGDAAVANTKGFSGNSGNDGASERPVSLGDCQGETYVTD